VLSLRYGSWWLGFGLSALVMILAVALLPVATPIPVRAGDKVLHFLAFAFLTVWFLGLFEWRMGWRIAALLVAYGVLIEVLQSFTAMRLADSYDLIADVSGIATGWLLARAGLRHWCQWVEGALGVTPP
jgi:VanZ family protein